MEPLTSVEELYGAWILVTVLLALLHAVVSCLWPRWVTDTYLGRAMTASVIVPIIVSYCLLLVGPPAEWSLFTHNLTQSTKNHAAPRNSSLHAEARRG
jgi:hypothetical protein